MLKSNIDVFLVTSFLCSLKFLLFHLSMFFQWIDNDPISVLYESQIDISTNSWEIKYQNMGIGLLHVKRRTRQKWR